MRGASLPVTATVPRHIVETHVNRWLRREAIRQIRRALNLCGTTLRRRKPGPFSRNPCRVPSIPRVVNTGRPICNCSMILSPRGIARDVPSAPRPSIASPRRCVRGHDRSPLMPHETLAQAAWASRTRVAPRVAGATTGLHEAMDAADGTMDYRRLISDGSSDWGRRDGTMGDRRRAQGVGSAPCG